MTTPTLLLPLLAQSGGPIVPGASAPPASESAPASVQPAGPQSSPAPAGPGGFGGMFLPLIVVMIVLVLMTTLGGRKEKKRRAAMLAAVAKNDRVQTVGGVIGTVVELSDSEMVLRVDEASNTRVRFARSAIQQVLRSSRDKSTVTDLEVKPAIPTRV